ncbi:glutamate synthase central domain-containing protein, partial [Halorubrum pallidum]
MTEPRSNTRGVSDADPAGHTGGLAAVSDNRSNCGIGGIVDLEGTPNHETVTDAIELLENLEHRGTTGAEKNTGDGAGIMVARPDAFFREVVDANLPEEYAVGSVFMPTEPSVQAEIHDIIAEVFSVYGLEVLAWRSVPTDNADLGETALDSEPEVAQLFAAPVEGAGLAERFTDETDRDEDVDPEILGFDRALYAARREIENAVSDVDGAGRFYVCSLDRQRVVYKGLLKGSQLAGYYPDLTDERFASHVALVHARFSTNTLGAWHLAHPYRNIVHNGEFNTIRGNVNWMRARENDLDHPAFGAELDTIKPVIDDPNQSDTASVDNAVELLLQAGRDLPHTLRMLIPEAFRDDDLMDAARTEFYDYHASLVEPWDGPALVIGFDGDRVAGVLDRNGLRPCRYEVTEDDRLIVGSEVGALPTDPSEVTRRGRLQPGEIFVADPEEGRIVPDDEVFDELTDEKYGEWVDERQVDLDAVAASVDTDGDGRGATHSDDSTDDAGVKPTVRAHQAAFGYTTDSLNHLVEPMAEKGKDPVGSMGDDTPLSVLTDVDRPLFTYFKQLFAQVSNPPIDYIREELVTSLETRMGNQRNLLDETPDHAQQIVSDSPILTDAETAALKNLSGEPLDDDGDGPAFTSTVVDTTYGRDGSLVDAVTRIREDAAAAIRSGADVVVLSDRAVGPDR